MSDQQTRTVEITNEQQVVNKQQLAQLICIKNAQAEKLAVYEPALQSALNLVMFIKDSIFKGKMPNKLGLGAFITIAKNAYSTITELGKDDERLKQLGHDIEIVQQLAQYMKPEDLATLKIDSDAGE